MKLLVVSLFNSYLGCYDQPTFVKVKAEDIAEEYRRSVLANPENAYQAKAQDKIVCVLGEFDDVSGLFELNETPKKILDLAAAFPPGYLKKKESV